MKIEDLRIGMEVRHPQYGIGKVLALDTQAARVQFDDATREVSPGLSDLQPASATARLDGLELPLSDLLNQTVEALVTRLGLGRSDEIVKELAQRWRGGMLILKPVDPTLQTKEVELETFFHKIVMMRNNLRLLEQKVNGQEQLSSADKFDLQQYITRCYGSMTTFNILFKNKEDQFSTKGG